MNHFDETAVAMRVRRADFTVAVCEEIKERKKEK